MDAPVWAVLTAAAPILLLAVLVLRSRPLAPSAWLCGGVTAVLAVTVFDLGGLELGVGVLRGLWAGTWILLIVLPALLLFELVERSGALEQLSAAAQHLAPTDGRRRLLLAFALPSFLQGAAGFGAPIAVSAPLLARTGMSATAAIATCLIGYQWSVTFGSMGASYFMASATAGFSAEQATDLAGRAGIVLGITAVVSALLVLWRGERRRGDLLRATVLSGLMGTTLIVVAHVQPALSSMAAGLVGLVACWWLLPDRGASRPAGGQLLAAAAPYVALMSTAILGLAVPPINDVLARMPDVAPQLPGSSAAFGFRTPDAALTPAFRPLLHPLPYLAVAILVAVVGYRRLGWWTRGLGRAAVAGWWSRSTKVSLSILGMTVLAAVLNEAGMIALIADALAATFGIAFVALSAPLGALGTVLTGSTTASNALFSSLQAGVATSLGILVTVLVTGQTAGGNIGNAVSPATAAVGAAACGVAGREGEVVRANVRAAGALALVVLGTLVAQLLLFSG